MDRRVLSAVRSGRAVVELLRPANAAGVMLAFGIGYCWLRPATSWSEALIGLVLIALIHSAATLHNDLTDLAVDRDNHRAGPLQNGALSHRQAKIIILALLGTAVIFITGSAHPAVHSLYGLVAAGLSWAYNSRPFQLSHRPLASVATLGFAYGALPVLYGAVAAGTPLTPGLVATAIAWLALRASVSILKDFKDAAGDRRHHKHTFYLRYGRAAVARVSLLLHTLGAGAALLLIAGAARSAWSLLALPLIAAAALSGLLQRRQLRTTATAPELARLFEPIVTRQKLFELGSLACLILSLR